MCVDTTLDLIDREIEDLSSKMSLSYGSNFTLQKRIDNLIMAKFTINQLLLKGDR